MKKPEKIDIFVLPEGQGVAEKEIWNSCCKNWEKWIIERLKEIQYEGMPKPQSHQKCSQYYSDSIDRLIKDVKK